MAIGNAINDPESPPYLAKAGGTMVGNLILNGDPSTANQAANKNYVDTVAQGLNVIAACRLATTAALTVTYANGTAGVGATLTNAGAQVALSIDSVATVVGNRILVKNQASALQNGVYTVTDIGSGSTNWVMTRAIDYDTPAQINPGDFVLIDFGTANSGSGWIQTATVASIGTDPINFSRFGNQNAINKIVVQSFGAGTSTYTPTAGMQFCTVEICGGGGGSGGTACTAADTCAGAGGGGGGYCRKTYTAALLGATATVVVGAKGTAGTAGANPGTAGGNSTFTPAGAGVVLTANGGGGGAGGTGTTGAQLVQNGGAGGTALSGDLIIHGSQGGLTLVVNGAAASAIFVAGAGGSSYLSQTTRAVNNTGSNAAHNYGGGGQGRPNVSGANEAGNDGADGLCLITEYCSVTS